MSSVLIYTLCFHWNKFKNQPLWNIWYETSLWAARMVMHVYGMKCGSVICRDRRWTWWSLWVSSDTGHSVMTYSVTLTPQLLADMKDHEQPWWVSGLVTILDLWSWFAILILNYTLLLTNAFTTAKRSSDDLHKTFPLLQTSCFECVLFVRWDWPSGWYCWSFTWARTRAEWIHTLILICIQKRNLF